MRTFRIFIRPFGIHTLLTFLNSVIHCFLFVFGPWLVHGVFGLLFFWGGIRVFWFVVRSRCRSCIATLVLFWRAAPRLLRLCCCACVAALVVLCIGCYAWRCCLSLCCLAGVALRVVLAAPALPRVIPCTCAAAHVWFCAALGVVLRCT